MAKFNPLIFLGIDLTGQDVNISTTDDLAEGTVNLYFTDERAEDAVGNILTDTSTIDFTYNDAGNQITADIKPLSIDNSLISTTAAIDASKIADGSVSNTEFQYINSVTSNVQTQLDNKEPIVTAVNAGRTFWVDGNRTDIYTQDGTILHPFKDPQDAITQIITNGDNTSTRPYTLMIAPFLYGNLTLSDPALVYVNLQGISGTRFASPSFNIITLSGANIFRGGIQNLNIVNLILSSSAASNEIDVHNCKIGQADVSNVADVEFDSTQIGNFNLTNAPFVFFQNGWLGVTAVTTMINSNMVFQSSSFLSSVNIDATSGLFIRNGVRMTSGTLTINGTMQAYSAWIGVSIVINTGGSLLNRGSFIDPANISGTAGLSAYTQGTTSQMIGYTPTTSSNWNSVPTHVRGALDTLATSGIVKSQSQNLFLASPNGSSGLMTPRAIVAADLPASILTNALTDSHILVGNSSNVATDVAASGDVTLANTGAFTVVTVGASSASNIHSAELAANAATSSNTSSTIIKRDASGNARVSDPLNAQDIATKNYVDTSFNGIYQTSFTALDNQAVAQNVTGFAFTGKSFRALVYVERNTTYASFSFLGTKKAASWTMSQEFDGDDTGITFSIDNTGQIQYTSTSTGSNASLNFRAEILS